MTTQNFRDIYFQTVKSVLDKAINDYCQDNQVLSDDVDKLIVNHIKSTADAHRNPDPDIDYFEPLCRLGYLYVHAGANATLFEWALTFDESLSALVEAHAGRSLSICAVGGGPGTELLGLSKYLLLQSSVPSSISFSILDNVPQWSETWSHLADAIQELLNTHLRVRVTINRSFHPMDVVDANGYRSYAWLFRQTDLFVYNYLLSENQVRMQHFVAALNEMATRASVGSYFLVIDRLERNTNFREQARIAMIKSGLSIVSEYEFGGVMTDGESALLPYTMRFQPRRPRRWFRTLHAHHPTVFVVVAKKEDSLV